MTSGPAPTTTSITVATATTGTYTVIGTTPDGETVTATNTQITRTPAGPQGLPLEAGAPIGAQTDTTIQGQIVDGVGCSHLDQLAYAVSAHLQIYVAGRPRALPGTIGLVGLRASNTGTVTTYAQGLCSYWLHTNAPDGIIQVRSPVPRTYTLGQLFDIWGEPLSTRQVASATGPVTVTVDGTVRHGNPRTLPLREHESIQLAVGRPVPRFKPVDWNLTDL